MKYKVFYKGSQLIEYDTLVECIACVSRMISILNGGASVDDFDIYRQEDDVMKLVK